jgi:hypothetical protein
LTISTDDRPVYTSIDDRAKRRRTKRTKGRQNEHKSEAGSSHRSLLPLNGDSAGILSANGKVVNNVVVSVDRSTYANPIFVVQWPLAVQRLELGMLCELANFVGAKTE